MTVDARIPVTTPTGAGYDVVVGRSLTDEIRMSLAPGVEQVLIVHQPTLADQAERLRQELAPLQVLLAEVPDAEEGKRVEVAQFCWKILGEAAFTRSDAVIGLGGGAATDLAGWVAASWLRGIQVIQIPTSLLAMVDAAIGGKTGVNTAEGKNLVGAFYPPRAVIVDTDFLPTVPANELVASFGEIVKYGFIGAPDILDLLETDPNAALDVLGDVLPRIIRESIQLKASVVSEDFREAGQREMLNYGHTFGHAVEYCERYRWRHGAAVSVGMMFAAELSRLLGRIDDTCVERHRSILTGLGLPTRYRGGAWEELFTAMHRDKKARGSVLRFVLLGRDGRPGIVVGPDPHLLVAAYQAIAE